MTPYYADDWLTVYHGDALAVLATLPAESVHMVCTSPPYWGLRDYGTASWSGGDADCSHVGSVMRTAPPGTAKQASNHGALSVSSGDCGKCGAVREDGQLGLEATPEAYVAAMVAVFREVRRVLRKDGTVWLNLGDSYASAPPGNKVPRSERETEWGFSKTSHDARERSTSTVAPGLKPKDLVGIPWRVAFALQADGWYLRSDIIWAKPNPMPESVTDRPTKAHEYVFLLSRSPRYYFDADAVREANEHPNRTGTNPRLAVPHAGVGAHGSAISGGIESNPAGRNLRSVWTIATQPYPGAHFAVFPEALVEPCVKAGTSERGVCPECGAPWQRIVSTVPLSEIKVGGDTPKHRKRQALGMCSQKTGLSASNSHNASTPQSPERTTTGWRPSCGHDSEPVPATVLDPFAGSGTTGLVAQRLSRRAVLIDLSMDYLDQLMDRNRDIPLGLGA